MFLMNKHWKETVVTSFQAVVSGETEENRKDSVQ